MSAVRFGKRIDLQLNQILNAVVHSDNGLPTATTALKGVIRYNTADNRFYVCNGTAWELKATDSDLFGGQNPAYYRNLSNMNAGTITAAKVSDFDTAVNNRSLSSFTAPTADLALGSKKITGLAQGTANTDAVNKAQLDAVAAVAGAAASGVTIKAPVLAVAIGNISLSALPSTIDGVTIPNNGRFLLAGQTDATQNGIYRNNGGVGVRTSDADETGELIPGTQVFVTQGTANGDSSWAIISDNSINIGADQQQWAKVPGSSGANYTWGSGLQNNSGTVSVKPGTGISVADGSVAVDTAVVVRKFVKVLDAGATSAGIVTITHNLNTQDVQVQLREVSSGDFILVGVTVTGVNTINLDFDLTTIPANTYRVIVTG